jgi:hypothetical protein
MRELQRRSRSGDATRAACLERARTMETAWKVDPGIPWGSAAAAAPAVRLDQEAVDRLSGVIVRKPFREITNARLQR